MARGLDGVGGPRQGAVKSLAPEPRLDRVPFAPVADEGARRLAHEPTEHVLAVGPVRQLDHGRPNERVGHDPPAPEGVVEGEQVVDRGVDSVTVTSGPRDPVSRPGRPDERTRHPGWLEDALAENLSIHLPGHCFEDPGERDVVRVVVGERRSWLVGGPWSVLGDECLRDLRWYRARRVGVGDEGRQEVKAGRLVEEHPDRDLGVGPRVENLLDRVVEAESPLGDEGKDSRCRHLLRDRGDVERPVCRDGRAVVHARSESVQDGPIGARNRERAVEQTIGVESGQRRVEAGDPVGGLGGHGDAEDREEEGKTAHDRAGRSVSGHAQPSGVAPDRQRRVTSMVQVVVKVSPRSVLDSANQR